MQNPVIKKISGLKVPDDVSTTETVKSRRRAAIVRYSFYTRYTRTESRNGSLDIDKKNKNFQSVGAKNDATVCGLER